MDKYIVSYWTERNKTWKLTGAYNEKEHALGAARELFRDYLDTSDWIEVRITKLKGY